jgi:retron-type reverse transcriptase
LQPFLFASPFFPKYQSAYRPGYSTETALLSVLNDLYSYIDHSQAAFILSLDLSAAFDLLNHDILLRRLEDMFGLSPSVISLLRSYLSHRFFVVDCDGSLSAPQKLSFGVPQGSVLGPILFLYYVSPVVTILPAFSIDYHYYADDYHRNILSLSFPIWRNAYLRSNCGLFRII